VNYERKKRAISYETPCIDNNTVMAVQTYRPI